MKKFILASGLILLSATSWAAVTSCDAIKSKVETRLEGKGVKHYTLDVVAKDAETKNRVVGRCEGGSKKIIYARAGKSEKKPVE